MLASIITSVRFFVKHTAKLVHSMLSLHCYHPRWCEPLAVVLSPLLYARACSRSHNSACLSSQCHLCYSQSMKCQLFAYQWKNKSSWKLFSIKYHLEYFLYTISKCFLAHNSRVPGANITTGVKMRTAAEPKRSLTGLRGRLVGTGDRVQGNR